jgi:ATP-dependent DNA helicase PIF1
MGTNVIGAQIATGTNIGEVVYIHRQNLIPSDANVSISFRRRQFPLSVCFGMTINKSQGQTLGRVGLYLPRPVFTKYEQKLFYKNHYISFNFLKK